MHHLDRHVWEQLSPLLDRVLDMEPPARGAFIRDLHATAPDLAVRLTSLLEAHDRAAASGFLADGPLHPPAPAAGPLAGMTVGAYTLERPLGMGGMGTVWLGRRSDGQFAGTVAVKLVNLAMLDASTADRFAHEASVLARLTHPNIARLYDAGVTPLSQPYLVLEYVEGLRIDRYADEHRLDVRQRLGLFLQVADAVSHAHANLVVHRDLKPSNILVGADGRVKLLDFGIAKLVGEHDSAAGATASRSAALTPEYAAPEQVAGGAITTATDVYALGVLLFQLLSAQHPTAEGAQSAVQYLRALDRPAERLTAALRRAQAKGTAAESASARGTTPARLLRACQGDLDLITALALKQRPGERYASVLALADDIKRHLRRLPVSAQPDSVWYRARTLFARRRFETLAAVVTIAALVAGTGLALWQAQAAATERDFALRQLQRAQAQNDLNAFLLSDAAPVGRPFTAGELLRRALAIVDKARTTDVDQHAATLLTLGRQFNQLELRPDATAVLTRAYALARTSLDPGLKAATACEYANALGQQDSRAAARIADEGVRVVDRDDRYQLERMDCEIARSQIARRGANPATALPAAESAVAIADSIGVTSPLARFRASANLASAYSAAGRDADALREFERAFALLLTLGRAETETAATLLNNWGLATHFAGRPRDAAPLLDRAVAIETADGSAANVSAILLTNRGRTRLELGDLAGAISDFTQSLKTATARGDAASARTTRAMLATAYLTEHDTERASPVVADYAKDATGLPPGHAAHRLLALLQGDLAAAQGLVDDARTHYDRAVSLSDGDPARRGQLARALQTRAAFELNIGGHTAAARDAHAARELFHAVVLPGALSSQRGRANLILGRALVLLGRPSEASDALRRAFDELSKTIGPDHADTRAARSGLDQLGISSEP